MGLEGREKKGEYLGSRSYAALVGNRLRQARSWTGLQYVDVAAELGLDRDQIRKIEKGVWLPAVWELAVFAELYKCSLDWVLGASDDPKTRAEYVDAAQGSALEPAGNLEDLDRARREGERGEDRYEVPTEDRSRKKMCYSKRRFRNQEAAISAAIGSSRTYRQPMRPYRCPLCGGWHLTSKELPEFDPMAVAS